MPYSPSTKEQVKESSFNQEQKIEKTSFQCQVQVTLPNEESELYLYDPSPSNLLFLH